MKALHILYSGLGGASSVVFSLLNENKKNFLIKQDVLFTGDYLLKDYKRKVKETKSKWFFVKTKKFYSWLSWFEVFLRLYKEKPNLIFLHNFQFIPCLLYKFFFRTKIIYIDHQAINTRVLACFTTFICSILFLENYICVGKIKAILYKKNFNFFSYKIKFIPNSINTNFFKKNKIIKPNNHFRIGMASRIDLGKKQELIIRALKQPNLKPLNIIFTIVGEGSNLLKLKNLVDLEDLQNKVKFDGILNETDLKLWYEKLNLYAQATVGEGMSISIFEAMSMGVPVMGSNVIGVRNLLGKKKYVGILFNNEVNDISKKIEYFYNLNNKQQKLFTKHQRKFVIHNYSSPIMFNNYKKIILKVLPEVVN